MLTVVKPGVFSTIQDSGRPGWAHLGVPRSGAADPRSFAAANRLLGNRPGSAVIETTMGGLVLKAEESTTMALTGAPAPVYSGGFPMQLGRPFFVQAGASVEVSRPTFGLRNYLAVRGGFDVPPVLGSSSTDTLSGLGPRRLEARMTLVVGNAVTGPTRAADLYFTRAPVPGTLVEVGITWGPRDDCFTSDALRLMSESEWIITSEMDRVGVRLDGPPLAHEVANLPTEGTTVGAVQVPPSGRPIVFLADHPPTGGYPVICVVLFEDLDLIAQCTPGTRLRFAPRTRLRLGA